jgi:hypothetical protein
MRRLAVAYGGNRMRNGESSGTVWADDTDSRQNVIAGTLLAREGATAVVRAEPKRSNLRGGTAMRKMARRGHSIWRDGTVAAIVILAAVLAGCATPQAGTPRVMQEGDFKMLAGAWTGSTDIQGTVSVNIDGVIQDTGAYFIHPHGSSSGQASGFMKIVDGGVVYESSTSKGKMAFSESSDGKSWVWKWDGMTPDGRWVRNELTKSK